MPHVQSFHFLRQHIHGAIVLCQFAGDQGEGRATNRGAIAIVDVGSHDDVRHSGLVLHQQEDGALWGLRSLAPSTCSTFSPSTFSANTFTVPSSFANLPLTRTNGSPRIAAR